MGILRKLTGGTDKKLLETGVLGRAVLLGVDISGTTLQSGGGLVERKCTFTLQVTLDGEDPYQATCTQRIGEIYLPQLQPGASVVAVRVDPEDHQNVAIDFATAPPDVTLKRDPNRKSAAEVLASGTPAKGVIIESQPLGMKNPEGIDMYAFTLTVLLEGQAPYQIQVGNPTPPEAIPLLYPGSHVPVRIGDGPNEVVIDWKQGLADASGG